MTETRLTFARAGREMVWAGLTVALSKGAVVISTLVLARYLLPEDFGLFAVGLLVINYLDRFKDVGVGAALVYRREPWHAMAGTGLPLSVASALVLAGIAYLSAPVAAAFFGDPRATELVEVLAVVILVAGLGVVPESKLRRELDFARRLVPETVAAVVKGGLSIALAVAGFGVWSLVWGQLAGTTVQALLYWALCGWRPRMSWHASDARRLLRYGIPSAGIALFAVIVENLDYLVVGRRMGSEELGYYVMAYRMPELLVVGICLVASQVLFPYFSRLQDDPAALRRAYLVAVRKLALLTVPAGLVLTLLAEEIILTLYSERWAPAVPVLRVLGLFTVVESLGFHAGDVYKATGRPGILNLLAVVTLVVLTPALWVAAGHSITAVAFALLFGTVLLTVVKLVVAKRILDLPVLGLARAFAPALLAGAGMAAVVVVAGVLLPALSPQLRLAILVPVAGLSYAGALLVTAPGDVRQVASAVATRLRR